MIDQDPNAHALLRTAVGQPEPVADAAHSLHEVPRPSLVRRLAMCTSSVRLATGPVRPHTSATIRFRVHTAPPELASIASTWNSFRLSGTDRPSTVTVCRCRSIVTSSSTTTSAGSPSEPGPARRRRYTACTRASSSPMS